MSKIYTAQEMRERAEMCERYSDVATAEMLRQAADALEREKKYEYRITTVVADYGFLTLEKAKEFKRHHKLDEPIFRREVGEWEKLKE